MGKSILNTVLDLLTEGGISAAPAQPQGQMPRLHSGVAAVSIGKVDTAKETATVLVEVVSPMKNGAKQCQDKALKVCDLLSAAGAECVQSGCSFDSRAALFCVPVTALFHGKATADDWIPKEEPEEIPKEVWTISADGQTLLQVRSFSAKQAVDLQYKTLADAPWEFTLEEFFPEGTQEPAELQEPFSVHVSGQVFSGCTLTERRRVYTEQGIEQVRKGVATARTVT